MTKYSEQFKLMVVKEYLNGPLGYNLLVLKYGIKSQKQLLNWVSAYKQHGVAGLVLRKKYKVYPVQFKLDVLSFMKRTGASQAETAKHFGLTNPPMIASWKKKFLEGGAEALDNSRGRPAMADKKKKVKKNSKPDRQEKMTREQTLERENELLRLEVEYLKKLRAFQEDPDAYLEKHKQRYRSNLKKNTD